MSCFPSTQKHFMTSFFLHNTKLLKQVHDPTNMTDQACGCEADTGDPDYKCDCDMQSACICSTDCTCQCQICKESVSQL